MTTSSPFAAWLTARAAVAMLSRACPLEISKQGRSRRNRLFNKT
ncbi:hypothetical protein WMW72_03960 [Paenibacillus filicis]|uniref:Uncharacterized protein n=1 Tax=Paenibacillus filicis TaxID=669464 RepID=A0ABU9DE02_9BACL